MAFVTGSNREKTDADLLRELEGLLQPQIATAQRCRTLKELCESDRINRLEDVSILVYAREILIAFTVNIFHELQ